MWLIKNKDGELNYPVEALVQQLVGKMISQDIKHDQFLVIDRIINSTSADAFASAPPKELMTLAFRLGYLYRLFLERNNVVCPEAPTTKEIATCDSNSDGESTISSLDNIH